MWDQMCKALRFLVREVDLHMCGMFSKVVEDLFRGSAKHIMNLIDLVKFVVAGKQRAEREDQRARARARGPADRSRKPGFHDDPSVVAPSSRSHPRKHANTQTRKHAQSQDITEDTSLAM